MEFILNIFCVGGGGAKIQALIGCLHVVRCLSDSGASICCIRVRLSERPNGRGLGLVEICSLVTLLRMYRSAPMHEKRGFLYERPLAVE